MTNKELQEKYPAYSKSIFSDIMPDNPEVMGWQENVLQKVKGHSILPHYISRDRDFDVFWGWITHFFAIIVFFARNFIKFFTNYTEYLDEVGEFMRERDYIQDSRVKINEDLKIPLTEEIYHKIIVNEKLYNGVAIPTNGYYCTDYLAISEGNVIILKVLGYNKSIREYIPIPVNNINIAYYYADKSLAYVDKKTYSLSAFYAQYGKRIGLKTSDDSNSPYCYIRISYPFLGSAGSTFDYTFDYTFYYIPNLPLYLGVFLEGDGIAFKTLNSEKAIFDVFSDFRKRGTFKGASLIKKVLETKKEDNFYADYLPQVNTGWFLNRTSPTFQELFEEVKIDALIPSAFAPIGFTYLLDSEGYHLLDKDGYLLSYTQAAGPNGGECVIIPHDLPFPVPMEQEDRINSLICLKDQYFLLNQNTSIVMKWIGDVYIKSPYDSLSDSEGYELLDKAGDILVTPEAVTPSSSSDTGDSEIIFFLSIYDKDKNLITDVPLLGDWNYSQADKVVIPNYVGNGKYKVISVKPKYDYLEGKYYAELPIEILDTPKEAIFPDKTYDKDWFISNNKLYLFTKKNNAGTHEAYYVKINYIQMIYADVKASNGYNGYDGYLENFEIGLYLRKLPITMGFLNIKQYYLCCFKNNSSYTDAKAKEIIDQKIIPYNGYRIFLDNSYYKNRITVPLEFISINYVRLNNNTIDVTIKIKGGVPDYTYNINDSVIQSSYKFQEYTANIGIGDNGGKLIITVTDAIGNKIIETLSYSVYNGLNYKFRLFVDINSNLKSLVFVSGGSEASYNIERRDTNDDSIIIGKIIPANTWIDITDILPAISSSILNNKYIKIRDNFSTLFVDIPKEDFMQFGLDIYDNGNGELID